MFSVTLSKPKDDGMFVFEFLNSEYAIHVINVCSDDGLRWGGKNSPAHQYSSEKRGVEWEGGSLKFT
jgi:hypothetical protein